MELQTSYHNIPQVERNVGCICDPKWGKFTSCGLFVGRDGEVERIPHPIAREGVITIPERNVHADRDIEGLVFIGYDEIRPCGSIRNTFLSGSVVSYLEMTVDQGNAMIARMGVVGSDFIQEPADFVRKISLYKPKCWLIKFHNGYFYEMAVIGYNRAGFVQYYSKWEVE